MSELSSRLPAPELSIPGSRSTVDVRVIDTTTHGAADVSVVFDTPVPGFKKFEFPSYAFLVTNTALKKHILFDLGMAKDWASLLPPRTQEWIQQYMPFTVKKDVQEILDEDSGGLGIKAHDISSVIWSHHHFDHRGDMTKFPASVELVLGPGFQSAYRPCYPESPTSSINESEMRGRNIRELDASEFDVSVGPFGGHDFFGDGSFYLLSIPGHTVGHLGALARVTSMPKPTFVFIGADCAHHPGVFRPAPTLPLPSDVPVLTGPLSHISTCPGAWIQENVHPKNSATEPFLTPRIGANENQPVAAQSVAKMQEFDCAEEILLCIAHDASLLRTIKFYPEKVNDWKESGLESNEWEKKVKWGFCSDFALQAS